ncbi:MAG: palindromic element RPE4 domain-containing protein [Rickettsia endosymbiont of Eriopis connexa]|nr:palindromic element RPE4 domain-containing protein [Rickettsia endosymbiont of Eriopis connexa]
MNNIVIPWPRHSIQLKILVCLIVFLDTVVKPRYDIPSKKIVTVAATDKPATIPRLGIRNIKVEVK